LYRITMKHPALGEHHQGAMVMGDSMLVPVVPRPGATALAECVNVGTGRALAMIANRGVLTTGVMIFFPVATDPGFVYRLSEYFKTELGVSLRLASSVTGVYLLGIISGRLLMPLALSRCCPRASPWPSGGWCSLCSSAPSRSQSGWRGRSGSAPPRQRCCLWGRWRRVCGRGGRRRNRVEHGARYPLKGL
jgi:hypothetical protein